MSRICNTKLVLTKNCGWGARKFGKFFFSILSVTATLLLCNITGHGAEVDELTAKSEFIFKGTLQKLQGVTMSTVPVSDKTVVVKVDEILQAPESLRDFTGKEVTVLLSQPPESKVGDQTIYFTNGWLYGQSIAVVEVGKPRKPVHAAHEAALAAQNEQVTKAVAKLGDKDLRKRVASGDLIVVGKVTSVNPAAAVEAAMKTARLTEHDPQFLEATIVIERTEKGALEGNTVKVVFPSSTDVMWYKAPKLKVGQEGAFILHTGEVQRMMAGIRLPRIYTILEPSDVQPKERQEQLRNLIRSLP